MKLQVGHLGCPNRGFLLSCPAVYFMHKSVQIHQVMHTGLRKCISTAASVVPNMDALRLDDEELDLLLLHLTQTTERGTSTVPAAGASDIAADSSTDKLLSWVDALCQELDKIPGIAETLMLVVLMSVV